MNAKARFLILLIFPLGIIMDGCARSVGKSAFDIESVRSYRDIPGVTAEDIRAIEALKALRHSFSFGTMHSAEAFVLPDGSYSGYLTMVCELLSELFGIPFEQVFYPWDEFTYALDSGDVDFIGEMTATPGSRMRYYMSLPIAERPLEIFTIGNSVNNIEAARDLNGLRIGFYENSAIVRSIRRLYPSLNFEVIYFRNNMDLAAALEAGAIDAFICNTVEAYYFIDFAPFRPREILPLIHTPVSLAARNHELAPVISVLNKYILSGGIDVLHRLYREGRREYARYELNHQLSDAERAYLADYNSRGLPLPIALEPDNYPVSFFNEAEGVFQGIAPDVLIEISDLTGIEFNVITDKDTTWGAILEMLNTGEAVLVSELLYSEGRKNNYLWSEPFSISNYALLSKMEYPNVEVYQIPRATVGIAIGTAYEEMYKQWFRYDSNVRYYNTQRELLDALERGEINLAMSSAKVLLYLTNYREQSGYKINYLFDLPIVESRFGFNKNEELLCSIIGKAKKYIDDNRIVVNWTNRTFDYSKKMAETRLLYFNVSAICLSVLLLAMILLLVKNTKTRGLYKNQMITLSAIYKSLPDLVYSKDINGKYTSCNSTFEKFVELREAEIIGKTPFEVFKDTKLAEDFYQYDKKLIESNLSAKSEKWLTYPDNTRHLLETINTPLVQSGKTIGLLGIARDITDHKQAEAAANDASKAKSDFLAKMSHEIRTPMNAIIGMAELALREASLQDAQKHILTVKQAGSHLLNIINDILDFSKIEKGKLEIKSAEYNFTNLISNVISITRMRLIDSEIKFIVNVDCNIPNILLGDETRIRQVLLNILINAVKYTDKGFISLTVKNAKTDEGKINLIVEILDSGVGIRKENIDKLFNEYAQFDFGKKSLEGVGLGLAITKNILNKLDGKIEVSSEYGKGSSFIVTMPQKVVSFEPLACINNPNDKIILLYEKRELYAGSIISAFENLKLNYKLVTDETGLTEELKTNKYNYIFVSSKLLEKSKEKFSCLNDAVRIVMLTEVGETIFNKKVNIIALPIYSISIANILNGITDNYSYSEGNEQIIRFAAPEAKILVVDDINTNLKVAEGLMAPYQMKVDLCGSGREAIEIVNKEKYDIIFMDHKMPDIDGVMAAGIIRSKKDNNNYYKNVPIIALTANAVLGIKDMFLENGFNDFLPKPIDTIELDAILEKWLPGDKKKNHKWKRSKHFTDFDREIDIDGVDVRTGIHLSGGTVELYLETLNIFFHDCVNKIKIIQSAISSMDLVNYTITIHAIKSALANIGAVEMAFKAEALERAAEEGNMEYIVDFNGSFIFLLEELMDKTEKKINTYKKMHPKETMIMDSFISDLLTLKKALDSMDAGTVNRTIEDLKKKISDDDIDMAVDEIADKILIGEYEEASSLVYKLYQDVNNAK